MNFSFRFLFCFILVFKYRLIMESFMEIAKKGKNLCFEVIAVLAFDFVVIFRFVEDFFISLFRMKKYYVIGVKIRVVGNKFGRIILEKLCKLLFELVDFAVKFKCKKRFKFDFI